ncbi:hypothetical protein MNZ22_12165 [Aeromonas encheleia]|nr:hypothetical protein [Aeromonas encheleia]UNP90718.1 hypothetical protein MNZ22_12165 [Aeromonas encheleia]
MAEDIHLVPYLAYLGEQLAQLLEPRIGLEIGRHDRLGLHDGLSLAQQGQVHRRRLLIQALPQQDVVQQQGVEVIIHGPNLGAVSHGFTSWRR